MKKLFLAAGAAFSLAACGNLGVGRDAATNSVEQAVDEQALRAAVDRAVDEKALGQVVTGAAKGAVDRAVRDAIQEVVPVPSAEMRAVGAAIDEEALVRGIGNAIDPDAVKGAVEGAVRDSAPTR